MAQKKKKSGEGGGKKRGYNVKRTDRNDNSAKSDTQWKPYHSCFYPFLPFCFAEQFLPSYRSFFGTSLFGTRSCLNTCPFLRITLHRYVTNEVPHYANNSMHASALIASFFAQNQSAGTCMKKVVAFVRLARHVRRSCCRCSFVIITQVSQCIQLLQTNDIKTSLVVY